MPISRKHFSETKRKAEVNSIIVKFLKHFPRKQNEKKSDSCARQLSNNVPLLDSNGKLGTNTISDLNADNLTSSEVHLPRCSHILTQELPI